jgi:hypothetical protein
VSRPLPRANQVLRQWRLLVLLRRDWWTLKQMAAQLGCCTRTVRRDLAVLETVPFPIQQRREVDDIGCDAEARYTVGTMVEWPRRESCPLRDVA